MKTIVRFCMYAVRCLLALGLLVGLISDWPYPPPAIAADQDCDIWWNEVLHDTFDQDYRSPGGAVTPGTTVKIRLRVAEQDISVAHLYVLDAFTGVLTGYAMYWDGDFDNGNTTYDWYYRDLPVGPDPTILYYHFWIFDDGDGICISDNDFYVDDDPQFYGGGYGAMVDWYGSYDVSRSFQITVYDPEFAVPDWMQRGVAYQVFPDRFRDGDMANNPVAGRFSYNTSGAITRSHTTANGANPAGDWNFTVCDPRDTYAPGCTDKYGDNFYGGDLKGITQKINAGYFDALGVSVLYLNPIFRAPSNHKYDTADYMTIDPDFGTLQDFQDLAAAAQAHNIKLMLDGVFNHTSSDSTYFDRYHRYDANGNLTSPGGVGTDDDSGACEAHSSNFYSWFYFPDTGHPGQDGGTTVYCQNDDDPPNGPQTYEAWYGYSSLPKLQANATAVRDLIWADGLNSVGPYWTAQGADGWRFDVGADIDCGLTCDKMNDYWEGFRAAVRAITDTGKTDTLMLGEEWGDASPWLLGNEWDSVMNYRFRSAVLGWLFTGCSGDGCTGGTVFEDNDSNSGSSSGTISYLSPSQFNARLRSIEEDYPPMAFKAMMNLEGSHDTNRLRFLLKKINNNNDGAALQRMKEWWLFAFTYAGAPTLYYGDEIALSHDGVYHNGKWEDDPYNRAPYPWPDASGSSYQPVTPTLAFARKMSSIRWSYRALQDGDVQHGLVISDTGKLYGFGRTITSTTATTTALVLLNRDSSQHTLDLTGLDAAPYHLISGTVLYDAIEGNDYTVISGSVSVPVNPSWGVVLLEKLKLDTPVAASPVITRDASNVYLTWSPVITDAHGEREVVTAYEVHRSATSSFTPGAGTRLATVSLPDFGSADGRVHYTDSGAAGSGYYYIVRAANAADTYADSAARQAVLMSQEGGGGWGDSATWGGAVPTASDPVLLAAGTTVTLTGSGACYSLTVEHGGTLFISGTLHVSGGVVNGGALRQRQRVNNGSADFLNLGHYRGATLTTTHDLGVVTATVRIPTLAEPCTGNPNSPAYAGRCFRIEATHNQSATVRLWARASELNGLTPPLRIFHNEGGATWTALTANAGAGTLGDYIYVQGDTPGFSYFLIGESGNAPTALGIASFMPRSGLALVLVLGGALALALLWRKK